MSKTNAKTVGCLIVIGAFAIGVLVGLFINNIIN